MRARPARHQPRRDERDHQAGHRADQHVLEHELPPDEVVARLGRGGEGEHRRQRQAVVQARLQVERVANDARHARVGDDARGEHRVGRRQQRPDQQRLGPVQVGQRVARRARPAARSAASPARACATAGATPSAASPPRPRARRGTGSGSARRPPAPARSPSADRGRAPRARPGRARSRRPRRPRRARGSCAARARDSSAPAISSTPNTAAGSCRKSTPAATGGTRGSYLDRRVRRALAPIAALAVVFPAAAAAAPPRAQTLSQGWEVRSQEAAPAPPPAGAAAGGPARGRAGRAGHHARAQASQQATRWSPVTIPSVFNTKAVASEYAGQVRRYRLRFTGPDARRAASAG